MVRTHRSLAFSPSTANRRRHMYPFYEVLLCTRPSLQGRPWAIGQFRQLPVGVFHEWKFSLRFELEACYIEKERLLCKGWHAACAHGTAGTTFIASAVFAKCSELRNCCCCRCVCFLPRVCLREREQSACLLASPSGYNLATRSYNRQSMA